MTNVHGMARLGVLAVGLGIGAAVAHAPVASADSSTDWSSTIDSLLSGASPAPATPINLFISFDGNTIYDGGGSATAETTSGEYGLAIAYGDDSYASATGGTGDYALAGGTNALALAGGESTDTGANYNTAIDIGNNADPGTYEAGIENGAFAGNADLVGSANAGTGTGSYDTAIDIGNNTNGANGGLDGAFAGAGGLSGGMGSGDGNNDTAIDVGNNIGRGDNSQALDGNGNYASESGGATGDFENAYAAQGNDNTAIGTTDNAAVFASGGNNSYAYLDGPANSTASASGDSNIAYILDPFGAAGSPDTAFAGTPSFSNDLAEVLFTHGNAEADTANLLYDIVSLFGHFSGSF